MWTVKSHGALGSYAVNVATLQSGHSEHLYRGVYVFIC